MNSVLVPWKRKRVPLGRDEHPVSQIQRQMNRILSDLLSGNSLIPEFVSEPLLQLGDRLGSFTPNMNVIKNDKEVTVTVELPGMDHNDIEISLNSEGLLIRGEKKSTSEKSEDGWSYFETQSGKFERIVSLNGLEVEDDKVDASFSKGILTIKLPLKIASQQATKKVSVRAA